MGLVRPLTYEDLSQVAALRSRAFERTRFPDVRDLERELERVFLQNPWRDPDITSLVSEDEAGSINGFIGVIPKPMKLRGRALRGAVCAQMMVAPEARGMVGLELYQALFAGPQDLTFTDIPTDATRAIWESLGGRCARVYALNWVVPVRPTRFFATQLKLGRLGRGARRVTRPIMEARDRRLHRRARLGRPANGPTHQREAFAPQVVAEHVSELAGRRTLHATYEQPAIEWLMEQVQRRWGADLRGGVVRNGSGAVAGWFLYVLSRGSTSHVLHLVAREGHHAQVLELMAEDAWQQGTIALRGRYDERTMKALQEGATFFEHDRKGVLVHSRDAELVSAVLSGTAMVTPLDGEWWMAF
jgi:predicted N-acetyltransferase YhbS